MEPTDKLLCNVTCVLNIITKLYNLYLRYMQVSVCISHPFQVFTAGSRFWNL